MFNIKYRKLVYERINRNEKKILKIVFRCKFISYFQAIGIFLVIAN